MVYTSPWALAAKLNMAFVLPMIIYIISLYEKNEYFNMVVLTSIPLYILVLHRYLLSGIRDLSALQLPAAIIIISGLLLATKKSWKNSLRDPDKNSKNKTTSASIYGSILLLTSIMLGGFSVVEFDSFIY